MLDSETKSRIDSARDILVGKVPDPKSQVEQITIALIYKFHLAINSQLPKVSRDFVRRRFGNTSPSARLKSIDSSFHLTLL